jgi:ABC-type Mn2+/Zn2+ transport system permease subunit
MLQLLPSFLCAAAMAVACATLSVFVVSRRWAFIGEGIAHSGFGGAGTAWMLALIFPALDTPDLGWIAYCGVTVFCLLSGLAIGALTRQGRTTSDTAIGIFMVASVAWGFVAQSAYSAHHGKQPRGWETFLFGDFHAVEPLFALTSTVLCAAIVLAVWLLGKEIVAYCFDPATAEASGVRAGFVHYLLILLVTATIVIGSRVVGSVLVTALLVLPGATALRMSRRLIPAIGGAIGLGLLGAVAGVFLSQKVHYLPAGPAIVLVLFAAFLVTLLVRKLRRT